MTALKLGYSKACESPEAGVRSYDRSREISRKPTGREVGLHRSGEGVSIEIQGRGADLQLVGREGASGASGTNVARRMSPLLGGMITLPETCEAPSLSVTASSRLALSIGSLKTTSMIVFSGTSRLCVGGLVRTTPGRAFTGTTIKYDTGCLIPPPSTATSMVSPAAAPTATGSNPPFTTGTLALLPVRRSRMLAPLASGIVPGGSDT